MVPNDEGHRCNRRKPGEDDEWALTREDKQEDDRNNEEAASGLRAGDRQ
jgi:hypothetical protein